MTYFAIWLKDGEVLEEVEFEDLLEARDYVMDQLALHRELLGATGVKVLR